jgi:nucleotide-binding universal stress UspA family protein
MNNVLLVVTPGAEAPKAAAYALQRARERGGELVVLGILDPEAHARVADALSEKGFVGERVSEDLVETLEREKRALAESQMQQLCEEAHRQGVVCRGRVEEGEPSEVCRRVVAEHGIAEAVLAAEKRSWVTRFLSRSAPVRLPTLAGCEVHIVEE